MDKEVSWLLKEKYVGVESEAFHADCERIKAGEPLAYIIGHIPFLGCTIYLNSRPLIPRPETEFWVEKAIAAIHQHPPAPRSDLGAPLGRTSGQIRILDLCAGSGCIGVAVAKHVPDAVVTFAEIDATHLPTIKKNLDANTTIYDSEQYHIVESDSFANINGKFDFVLSNPPYIDKAANTAAASVTAHEPALALFGGQNGTELIERIITAAPAYLNPHGQFWLEHEPFQAEAIAKMAMTCGFTCTAQPDQYGTLRYSVLVLQ